MPVLNEPATDDRLGTLAPPNGQPRSLKNESVALERVQLLWERRRTIFRFALWGLGIGVVVAILIPSKYDSVTQLMPPDTDTSGIAMLSALASKGGDALGGYAGDLLGIKSSGALFIGVLRSRTVEDALVNKFDLRKEYWVKQMAEARKELESRTSISEDRKSGIITISVRDHSPQRAQAMAQTYVDQLNLAVATLSTSSARREREFLEARLTAVKQDLDQAAREFSQFASKNTAIDITEQGKAMVEAAARLQGEVIAAEAQRQGLEQIYSKNNARVRSVQANIDELRRQLGKLGGSSSDAPPSVDSNSPYPSIRQLPLLGVTYSDLYRRTKIQEAVYETLTKQYELAKVQEAKEIPTVKVLDPASLPEHKAAPSRTSIVLLVLILASMTGAIWAMGRETWNRLNPEDPCKLVVYRVIGGMKQDWLLFRARVSNRRFNWYQLKKD